jgi:hypothetical protein
MRSQSVCQPYTFLDDIFQIHRETLVLNYLIIENTSLKTWISET